MLLFIVDDVTLADDEIVVERDGGATSEKVSRSKDVIEFAKKHGEGHYTLRKSPQLTPWILNEIRQNWPW